MVVSARPYYIAADIGGTNVLLELFEQRDGKVRSIHEQAYLSANFADFNALLADFLAQPAVVPAAAAIDTACFSVAGPVEGNASTLTNLGWQIDAPEVGARFGIPDVMLVNDFAAIGHGIPGLNEHELLTLQRGVPQPHGTRLVIGAGTGLGICTLTWQEELGDYAVHPSEGGHTDFAPTNATQDALLVALRKAFGQVSYERVVSGPGLLRIFSFLENSGAGVTSRELRAAMQRQEAAAAISEFAINKLDPLAVRALDLFVEIYGAFAGNMALTALARGGVYISGGIARKIANRLADGSFARAFAGQGRFSDMLRRYPLHIVTDRKVGLKGALQLALGQH